MKSSPRTMAILALIAGLILSGCGMLQTPAPTPTLPPTLTPTPTPIPPTPTPIPPDISGMVTSNEGKSANRYFVLCRIVEAGCESTSLLAVSNSDGYFEFQDVPPGDYYIFYDSGHENFYDAVKKWEGKTIRVKDVTWLVENFVTLNANGTFSFTLVAGMTLDQNSMYMTVYRFFAYSPFLWAHKCGTDSCASPEDVIPIIASVSDGELAQVEFEAYGPFGKLSGEIESLQSAESAPAKSGIPVVTSVEQRRETSSGGLVIYQDIYFQDSEGDVTRVDYEVVATTASGVSVEGGTIDISPAEQKSGAIITGEWGCGNETYEVTLRVTLADKLGNVSEPVDYTMVCGETSSEAPIQWNGIPIIPGAVDAGENMGDYQYTIERPVDEIKNFYKIAMSDLGWKLRQDMMDSIPTDLAFEKDGTFAFFKIDPDDDKYLVIIHLVQQ